MGTIWAIADLHLSLGVPQKKMDIFGEQWVDHHKKIQFHWENTISQNDLVLIAGDISWAMTIAQAMPDLEWIDALPGKKVMIRGNHDYWWSSISKVRQALPPSIHALQNDAWQWEDAAIAGTRLWDSDEINFTFPMDEARIAFTEEDLTRQKEIFAREIERLKLSLKALNQNAKVKIAMTHYPPIGNNLQSTQVSKLLEEFGIQICVFGHLHDLPIKNPFFGEHNGVKYYLTASDMLDFKPLKLLTI